ncbi:helix-turn-helix domain-containing protein, partial [Chryseobacterium indologenes]|uniref:helix-turn-helix domain-containing protein n=1 Tax=Chryseobacterium indologenes TaxID=253 RepID=UPI0016293330
DLEQDTIINKKTFEVYFRDHKPFLTTDLKITDIASAFSTNRSYLSKFIYEIYGMSFSQYINNWRVHEVKQLSSLDENSSESIEEISRMAGFGSVRSYWRAVKNNP